MRRFLLLCAILQMACLWSEVSHDEKVVQGKLPNGLSYYIRENRYPEKSAALRLVVKVGSVHEQEKERGVAHFVEHLVYRGSEHFSDGEVDSYLSSIGCKNGPDNNATTHFKSTIYQIDIPLEEEGSLDKALKILSDFASSATISDEAVEKERKVVLDELHQRGSAAGYRLFHKLAEFLFPDSFITKRNPGGLESIIQEVPPETVRNFYKRWYRPDRMALVAVGDFDKDSIQKKIEGHFSHLVSPQEELIEPTFEQTFKEAPKGTIHFDSELEETRLELTALLPTNEEEDAKKEWIAAAMTHLFRQRLEKLERGESPFLHTGVDDHNFADELPCFSITASLFEERYIEGLRALSHELQRVLKWGFTHAEWQKVKDQLQKEHQLKLDNYDRIDHSYFVYCCVDNFLTNSPLFSHMSETQEAIELINSITVEEINNTLNNSHFALPFTIFLSTPSPTIRDAGSIQNLIELFAEEQPTESIKEENSRTSFVVTPQSPPGKIESSYQNGEITYWTLSNGVELILKKTDLQRGIYHITLGAEGGLEAFSANEIHSARLATAYRIFSGINGLTHSELVNLIQTKRLFAAFNLQMGERSLSLEATPDCTEEAFQFIHEVFTDDTFHQHDWKRLVEKTRENLKHENNDPETLFYQFVQQTNTQNHYSFEPLDLNLVDEASARAAFKRLFGNPQEFTCVIVGDFDEKQIARLAEKYIASLYIPETTLKLPTLATHFPTTSLHKEFRAGHPSYDTTLITLPFDLKHEWGSATLCFRAALEILNLRLKDILRTQLGLTYGVSIGLSQPFYPDPSNATIQISFTSQSTDRSNMVELIFQEIERLKTTPPTDDEIATTQALLHTNKKESSLSNHYWTHTIFHSQYRTIPLTSLLAYKENIQALTPQNVHHAAQLLFHSPTHTVLSHLPETP